MQPRLEKPFPSLVSPVSNFVPGPDLRGGRQGEVDSARIRTATIEDQPNLLSESMTMISRWQTSYVYLKIQETRTLNWVNCLRRQRHDLSLACLLRLVPRINGFTQASGAHHAKVDGGKAGVQEECTRGLCLL